MVLVKDKASNNAPVIHIGPHKTGSTAIQQYSKVFYPDLALDKKMPWKYLKPNVKPLRTKLNFQHMLYS